jgi:sulfatase maturation enzyme AslB (radical SAM superfamily)
MESHDKPLCALPWFHQKVNTTGNIKPCCAWDEMAPGGISPNHNYDSDTFFDSDFMRKVRDTFAKGIMPANCKACSYIDSLKIDAESYRMASLRKAQELGVDFSNPQLLSQEVDLGNLCNIKCRTCHQRRSTKWTTDSEAFGMKSVGLLSSNWSLTDQQAKDIKELIFLGGEPMMYQDKICSELSKLGDRLSELRLNFTTNLTIPMKHDLVELVRRTKKTWIMCSIDGFAELNDYIRSDSQWQDIKNNLGQLVDLNSQHHNPEFGMSFTFSVFNAHDLPRLHDWWKDINDTIGVTLVTWPKIHDARNLPGDYKQELIERYKKLLTDHKQEPREDRSAHAMHSNSYQLAIVKIIAHLKQDADMEFWEWRKYLREHNQLLDDRRSQQLASVNPRLAAILD